MGIFRTLAKSFFVVIPAISMPLAAATAESSETDNERAILILDGSGSMWGRIDDTPKISIALDVIRGLLNDWSPKVELGVTTYGHREKGNCADIETLIPIGPVDPDGVMTAIEGLNPKGKTPLTEAVRQAANALRHTEERATVILVSDGKETCGVDPCAVAEELEASGIDFTVHVIGFDLDADEKAQLQCMADNTGGEFLSADNAPELHEAMATTVQLVAEPEPKPKRVIKLETAPVGTLRVENVTGDHVYVYETNQTNSDKVAYFTKTTTDAAQLKAGTYLLGTSQQPVTEVEIAPGADVVVDMKEHYGWLMVENVTGDHVYVYEPGQTYSSEVAYFTATTTDAAQLKAGAYLLGTSQQPVTEVEIAPGEEVVVDMTEHYGWLMVENVTGDHVYVYEPGQTYSSEVAYFTATTTEAAQLQAGTYKLGTSQQPVTEVEIAPGADVVVDMKEHYGWLTVENVTGDHVYVYEPGQTHSNKVAYFTETTTEAAQLQAGTYKLGTSKQELTTFEIAPGEEVVIDLGG